MPYPETRVAEIIVGKDTIMLLPPYLETLEDRSLPSAAYGPLPDFRPLMPSPGYDSRTFARQLDSDNRVAIRDELNLVPQTPAPRYDVDLDKEVLDALPRMPFPLDDLGERQPDDPFGIRRRYDTDALSSLVSSLEDGADEDSIASDSAGKQSASPREIAGEELQDHSRVDSEASGQPSALSAVASTDLFSSLDGGVLGDGTPEMMGLPGPFADTVFLDGWQTGLPAPQAELVPAGNKDLTIIAAYLVASPSAQPPAKVSPANEAETGPTDFIVGVEPKMTDPSPMRTTDSPMESSPQPLARESLPVAPARSSAAPPLKSDNGVTPLVDDKNSSPVAQESVDDGASTASESDEMPEEIGNGE
jgi:hypothetical protein